MQSSLFQVVNRYKLKWQKRGSCVLQNGTTKILRLSFCLLTYSTFENMAV